MPNRPHFKQLTAAEARRALYIDFEGEARRPPVLLGVHRRKGKGPRPFVRHDIVSPLFAPLFEPQELPVHDLHTAIRNLVRRAERKDRRIVAWSLHELEIVRTLDDADLVARFEARYCNARAFAERWRHACHGGDLPETNRLRDWLAMVGYRVPPDAPYGTAARTVRAIRLRLEGGREPTPGQLAKWGQLLEHNRYDCAGMRRVCQVAAAEVDAVRSA